MKQITFRELLNLMYEGKAPKQVKYKGEWYQKYGNVDSLIYSAKKNRLLSSVIGADHTIEAMAMYKCITIYDEVLDDKEKEYLSNMIKPFKKYVSHIRKETVCGQEQIVIVYKDYLDNIYDIENYGHYIHHTRNYTRIGLPTFKAGTMYKGMELWREYTLEELGL